MITNGLNILTAPLIFVLLITGCSSSVPETKNVTSKTTLKIGGPEYNYTKQIAEEFRKQNPDLT
jgi:ABC-type glycerol-3-phosphate transport system substrate-binding protein